MPLKNAGASSKPCASQASRRVSTNCLASPGSSGSCRCSCCARLDRAARDEWKFHPHCRFWPGSFDVLAGRTKEAELRERGTTMETPPQTAVVLAVQAGDQMAFAA